MEDAENLQNLNLLNAGFLAGSMEGLKLLFTRLSRELEEREYKCLDQVLLNGYLSMFFKKRNEFKKKMS
jgi:hypothetical protein